MRPLAADFGLTLVASASVKPPAFNLAPFDSGVLVTAVTTNSDAADEGIVPGDVIVRIQDHNVTTPDEVWFYASAARNAGQNRLLVMVVNGSGPKFVALPFRDEPLGCGRDGCVDGVPKPATSGFVR
jgi:serine protease Do